MQTAGNSKFALWQKQAGRGSTIETLKLPSFNSPVPPQLTAPGGYIADIPQGRLKTEIEKLAKQPEYAYLKQLQTAKNVNWKQVQLAYDKWDYKQEGLTPAGAAVVTIIVTALTYGYGAAAAGGATAAGSGAGAATAATTTTTATGATVAGTTVVGASASTASAMGMAALAALNSRAAVSLINNKGDIGKTLKELGKDDTVKAVITAAVTAGIADKLGAPAQWNNFNKTFADKLTANLATGAATGWPIPPLTAEV